MHSTRSVIIFGFVMCVIVALLLAGLFNVLKPIHDKNEAIYAKKAVLSAVADHIDGDFKDLDGDGIQEIFASQIEQLVVDMDGDILDKDGVEAKGHLGGLAEHVDMAREYKKPIEDQILPVFVFTKADGKKYYILSTRGKGLWDAIWGNIAFEQDLNTIAGVAFDHKAETPGLGAEIKDNTAWAKQFIGKKVYDKDGSFRSVFVRKGGARDDVYEVDGISGATITADGVSEMLSRGLKYYEPYLKTVKG